MQSSCGYLNVHAASEFPCLQIPEFYPTAMFAVLNVPGLHIEEISQPVLSLHAESVGSINILFGRGMFHLGAASIDVRRIGGSFVNSERLFW